MQRLLGKTPLIRLVKHVHTRRGRLHVIEVAHTFHIGLAGKNPKVTDQHMLHHHGERPAFDAEFHTIGATRAESYLTGPAATLDCSELGPLGCTAFGGRPRFYLLAVNI